MKVEMTVSSDGVETTVSREYEPNLMHGFPHSPDGTVVPALEDVTLAVAIAAVTAHHITPKE